VSALVGAGLAGKGITIHGLRSAAVSLYAARGLSMLETATVMGQANPGVTWKYYARLFDRSDAWAPVRAAQGSLEA
jgi:integrase